MKLMKFAAALLAAGVLAFSPAQAQDKGTIGIAMPTKRRVIIFFIVLSAMFLVHRAFAEEPTKAQPMQCRGPSGADSQAIEMATSPAT